MVKSYGGQKLWGAMERAMLGVTLSERKTYSHRVLKPIDDRRNNMKTMAGVTNKKSPQMR